MSASSSPPSFSVIVANWEGEAWIERALSSIQTAIRASDRGPGEVIVVDDASRDLSPRMIAEGFPKVRLVRNDRNLGFGASVHRGVEAARGELVVLLNNDLSVREDFFRHLLRPFDSDPGEDLFAVSARTLSWDGSAPNHVAMAAQWIEGRLQPAWSDPPEAAPTLFAQGGSMAMRRNVWMRLGGFDPIFAPGYWEDYDLCWRAAKAGYRILYEPRAAALHVGGGSMTRRFGRREVYLLRMRNHLLFEWLNLEDARLLGAHAAWLPRSLAREWMRAEGFAFTQAILRALAKLPAVLARRTSRTREAAPSPSTRQSPIPDSVLLRIGKDFQPSPAP